MIAHRSRPNVKVINLALQGGGAHGAYTWGVLDRLLEDGRIPIEGISANRFNPLDPDPPAGNWPREH